MYFESPDIHECEVGWEAVVVFLSQTPHGGDYLTVCKTTIDDWHIATEEKIGWVDSRIHIYPARNARIYGIWTLQYTEYGARAHSSVLSAL